MQPTITHRIPTFLAGLALLAPLGLAAQAPHGSRLTAETFGSASGDVPLPGLGLVLELVDGHTDQPRLRLFGGVPGHPAAILVAGERAAQAGVGPHGTQLLLGLNLRTLRGTFDARGMFELPLEGLAGLPEGSHVYAQGLHTGVLTLADGPLVQASHGIELGRHVDRPEPLGFDVLLPHLPAERALGSHRGLAELLQDALDSAGDSLRLALEVEASLGLGIEVVDAKAGGKVSVEFTVTRTEEGLYEVVLGADVAALVGVSGGTGAEAGLEGSLGLGGARLYHFHSAPGAARGMLGMTLALAFPDSAPVAEGLLGSGGAERVSELFELLDELQGRSLELEAFLRHAIDTQVTIAEAFRDRARSNLVAAKRALANAAWHEVPGRFAQVAVRNGQLAAATVLLRAANAAREQASLQLTLLRATLEARRAELDRLVQGLARIGRVVSAVALSRVYATEHFDGEELHVTQAAELEGKLGLPFVDVKGLESSLTGEVQRSMRVRVEREKANRPMCATLVISSQSALELVAANVQGFELARTRTIELAQSFERRSGHWEAAGASLGLHVDAHALGTFGLGLQSERGVGRAWSVTLSDEQLAAAGGLATSTSVEGLVARLGAALVEAELQDRRQQNVDFAFSIDVSGNGGGIEIEAEWADQGRRLARTARVAEAVGFVLTGGTQVLDLETGAVTSID